MHSLTVHRCTLRVVRSGGWGWGADTDELTRRAVAALSRALARLAETLPELLAGEHRIDAPVRATVRVSRAELAALAVGDAPPGPQWPGLPPPASLTDRLTRALASAVLPHVPQLIERDQESAIDDRTGFAGREPVAPRNSATRGRRGGARSSAPASPLLAQLLSWHAGGRLGLLFRSFSRATLQSWHDALVLVRAISIPTADEAGPIPEADPPALEAVAAAAGAVPPDAPADAATRLAQRIVALLELARRFGLPPADPRARIAVDRTFPAWPMSNAEPARDATSRAPTIRATEETVPASAERARTPSRVPRGGRPARFEARVESALPFLLLGPLARMGVLDTWAAVCEAEGRDDGMPEFAAALAMKVLSPPTHGWLHTPETVTAAAVFAGSLDTLPTDAISELARRADELLPPVVAAYQDALFVGHDPASAFVLRKLPPDPTGWLLCDSDGLFPVAHAGALRGALDPLGARGAALVVIDRESADAEALRLIDEAGVRFVTDAPPTRGEPWRAVRVTGHPACWTNDPGAQASCTVLAGQAPRWAELADAFWQEVVRDRPAAPACAGPAFDASLALVAGAALAQIAWELWREREPTDPVLTLERFADLGATVRVDEHAVMVRLPLGRRAEELGRHGLLDDVTGVPWFGGRVVRFGRG